MAFFSTPGRSGFFIARNLCGGSSPGPGGGIPLTSIVYGTPFKYNSGYSAKHVGSDIWFQTWDDLGHNITASNDSFGWQRVSPTSNFAISQLSDTTTGMTGTNINTMQPWGTISQGGSGAGGEPAGQFSFKAGGIISVHGALYVAVNRATNTTPGAPYQFMLQNMQLIKSTNHGANWTPQPPGPTTPYTSPTFTGYQQGNADFIQYGQDYQGVGATPGPKPDNADTYVYAFSTEGPYNNANHVYLSRIHIADLGKQPALASDWSWYQGGDGMLDSNWSQVWPSFPVFNGSLIFGASVGTQYIAAAQRYVRINWWYPSVTAQTGFDSTRSIWQAYQAPKPWGPWTTLGSQQTWFNVNPTPGVGLFSPHIMPASVAVNGSTITAMVCCAGDYNSQDPATGDYTLTLVPVTFNPPPPPPTLQTPPQVSGTPAVGQMLTCAPGTWTGSPTFTYLWQRDHSGNLGTGTTYVVVDADQGHSLSCTVTATNVGGSTPASSNAVTIPPPAGQATKVIFLTSGTSWTVPDDWSNTQNTIEAIGGGGAGCSSGGYGAGGGEYRKLTNFSTTPATVIPIVIGAGGVPTLSGSHVGTAGGNTVFNTTSLIAIGGGAGGTTAPGAGGTGGTGGTGNSGGTGGNNPISASPGGGGAGGPQGPGGNGSNDDGSYTNTTSGGSGAGGGNGGSATPATNGNNISGGQGGSARDGTPGGAGGGTTTPTGGNGANGSGGGGAWGNPAYAAGVPGGNGGNGVTWTATTGGATAGAGGGGGGGGRSGNPGPAGNGGNGGLYGGGGGDGGYQNGLGGTGAPGIIVITYTS